MRTITNPYPSPDVEEPKKEKIFETLENALEGTQVACDRCEKVVPASELSFLSVGCSYSDGNRGSSHYLVCKSCIEDFDKWWDYDYWDEIS